MVGVKDPRVLGALEAGQVIALPGVGGYQLAARHGGAGVTALVTLADDRDRLVVPYFAVGRMSQAESLSTDWSPKIRRLAVRFWPGPLIVIVGDGDASVRITMPKSRSVRSLCGRDGPLVMVAAHDTSGATLEDPDAVASTFAPSEVALIVDGGEVRGPGPSILDARETPPSVFEEGVLPAAYIEAALIMASRRKWLSRS